MNITEQFKERMAREDRANSMNVLGYRDEKPEDGTLEGLDFEEVERMLSTTITHEGKHYALEIVELNARRPPNPIHPKTQADLSRFDCYNLAQIEMIDDGWVKGVNDEKG